MKTGQLYIALSDQLLTWAQDAGQLFLFKIGTTSDPMKRLRQLNEGWSGDPKSGPCLNCTDWKFAERWHYPARAVANKDEKQLKTFLRSRWRVFDRHAFPQFQSQKANGASEVYQILPSELGDLDALVAHSGSSRNDLLTAALLEAVARHIREQIETVFLEMAGAKDEDEVYLPDFEDGEQEQDWFELEEERQRELSDQSADLLSDQVDHFRSDEEGWPYEDVPH